MKLKSRVDFILGDVRNLPFRNNSFNLVFNSGVIEQFDSPTDVLKEMIKVTKPKGRVMTLVPNLLYLWWNFKKRILNLLSRLWLSRGWPYGKERFFTFWHIGRLFKRPI